MLNACSWFAPKRAAHVNRREIELRIRDRIEAAGGARVWVKIRPGAPFPPETADTATEVVVAEGAVDAVLSAIRQEAKAAGLVCIARQAGSPGKGKTVETRLLHNSRLVGRWRLIPVRRLYCAAIIIDDLGEDLEAGRRLIRLPYPLTLSILPYLRHSAEIAEAAHRAGREVMLHLPMEPEPGSLVSPGRGEVRKGMSPNQVERTVLRDIDAVPYVAGANNHMGSRATTDARLMAAAMRVLAERGLFFVDSRTTPASVALDEARRAGLAAFYRSAFLDDVETVDYTLGELRRFQHVVEQQGVALAIGHPHPTTLAALEQFLPRLESANIRLVPVSELVRLPEVARLSPPRPAGQ
jgi:polysaccharide deacetylase 2 family uncharacterized protein YibQ